MKWKEGMNRQLEEERKGSKERRKKVEEIERC